MRSSVPDVRSRNIAMLVIRNMTMNGKTPSITRPMVSNTSGRLSNM
jgi:hypothetical protein